MAVAAAGARGLTRRFAIVDDSMWPALEQGDWVLAQRRRGVPGRGAVVVYTLGDHPDLFFVKRVVALPGERVVVADGQVHIDGHTLAEPWAASPTFPETEDVVPGEAVWVLGDNRAVSSTDSRTVGPVPLQDVGWKVMAIYWPSTRVGLV